MSEHYASGTTPLKTDTIRVLEVKILNALNAGAGGGGMVEQVGPPVNPPSNVNRPALSIDTSTGDFWYWNTTTQGWL